MRHHHQREPTGARAWWGWAVGRRVLVVVIVAARRTDMVWTGTQILEQNIKALATVLQAVATDAALSAHVAGTAA
jgi:hypothetical protein